MKWIGDRGSDCEGNPNYICYRSVFDHNCPAGPWYLCKEAGVDYSDLEKYVKRENEYREELSSTPFNKHLFECSGVQFWVPFLNSITESKYKIINK